MRGYLMIILFFLSGILTGACREPRKSIREIAFLGDSNLWTGGEDCSDERAWSTWLVRLKEIGLARSFARSGATITNTPTTTPDTTFYSELLHPQNTLYNQALRLVGAVAAGRIEAPEVIVIYGGTNDAWFQNRRPGLFEEEGYETITSSSLPSESTTLQKSLKLIVEVLKERVPGAELLLVGPPFMTKTTREEIKKINASMSAFGVSEGIRMIRLDSDSLLNPDEEIKHFTLTLDGVHTRPAGARRIGEYVSTSL